MSNGEQKPSERPEDWQKIGEQLAAGAMKIIPWAKGSEIIARALKMADGDAIAAALLLASDLGAKLVEAIIKAEEIADPAFGRMAALAVEDLLGVKADPGAFSPRRGAGAKEATARDAANVVLRTMGAEGGTLEPSLDPARKYLSTMLGFAFEGWLEGWMFELLSSLVPNIGQIESFSELDDTLSQVMGFGRLSRRVLSPIVDAAIVTPTEWHVQRTYRPKLLAAGEALRMYTAGHWSGDRLREELARQGYSDERILGLIANNVRHFSVGDLDLLVRVGQWTEGEAIQHLREQGFEAARAETAFTLERLKRIESFEAKLAANAVGAFARGDIDESQLSSSLDLVTLDTQDQARLRELAIQQRAFNVKRISPGQVEACVKAGILSVVDYRAALEREGYPPDDVTALELLLRHELEADRKVDELKAERERERQAAEEKRRADAEAKRLEAEARRLQARRGKLSDLETAVVRGKIPIDRYLEVLRGEFDEDTVQILVALVEDDRLRYLEEQLKREDAAKGGPPRQLDVGALERAVKRNVVTLDDFRRRLEAARFTPDAVDVLARTLAADLAEIADARRRRELAEARAAVRELSLSQWETLVRRGIRTLAEYRQALAGAGFDDVDVAALVTLLEQQLAEDQAARDARAAGEAVLRPRGLSLKQFERAVLRGQRSLDEYQTFLVAQRFDDESQTLLIADLEERLAEAAIARARQVQADTAAPAEQLPLSVVERAARVGVITPQQYLEVLAERGVSEVDRAVYLDLLLVDISETQRRRAQQAALDAAALDKPLTLAQFAAAVKVGARDVAQYRAELLSRNYAPEDVDALVAVLEDDLSVQKEAQKRHDRVAERLAKKQIELSAADAAVLEGVWTIDDYAGALKKWGATIEEIGLLVSLLVEQLAAQAESTPP